MLWVFVGRVCGFYDVSDYVALELRVEFGFCVCNRGLHLRIFDLWDVGLLVMVRFGGEYLRL